jgi:general secretion pathway protein L
MRRLAIDVSETLSRGFSWWTGELKSLLPARLGSGERRRKADLVAVVNDGTLVSTIPPLGDVTAGGEADILDKISQRARQGPVRVKVRVPLEECLVRPITLPKAAVKDIDRIMALELERATPFRMADVHAAVVLNPKAKGSVTVSGEQIVMKRSRLKALRDRLEAAGAEVVGADGYRDDPATPVPIDFLAERTADSAARGGILPSAGVLATACGTLALAALAITAYRHELALADLREQTAAVRSRLADSRAQQDTGDRFVADALAELKAQYPPVVALIDGVTRRMPDTAYLTEFRFADGAVELVGFGRPVRGLAVELEQSPYISSASITAPIVTDDERQKERFSLQLRLNTEWTTASGGGGP